MLKSATSYAESYADWSDAAPRYCNERKACQGIVVFECVALSCRGIASMTFGLIISAASRPPRITRSVAVSQSKYRPLLLAQRRRRAKAKPPYMLNISSRYTSLSQQVHQIQMPFLGIQFFSQGEAFSPPVNDLRLCSRGHGRYPGRTYLAPPSLLSRKGGLTIV